VLSRRRAILRNDWARHWIPGDHWATSSFLTLSSIILSIVASILALQTRLGLGSLSRSQTTDFGQSFESQRLAYAGARETREKNSHGDLASWFRTCVKVMTRVSAIIAGRCLSLSLHRLSTRRWCVRIHFHRRCDLRSMRQSAECQGYSKR